MVFYAVKTDSIEYLLFAKLGAKVLWTIVGKGNIIGIFNEG